MSTDPSPPPLCFSLNTNLRATSSPPIPLASAWAALYTPTPSTPLINLAQGVPGAPPPPEFQRRLGEAASDPKTTMYGDLRGDEGLRRALAGDINGVYGVREGGKKVGEEELALTAGCNLAFYATMLTLAKAGDEVILPTPWYFNAEMTLTQLGITPVPLPCAPPTFLPSASLCRTLVTPLTRAIVLITPNNPTGAIYPPSLIREFGELAREKGVALVVDETYREFLEGRPHELFVDEPEWRGFLVHLFSFSKSYAIPGHRLGALLASPRLLVELHKTLDCLQICPARPAQVACEWAVEGTREWREATRDAIMERGDVFREVMSGVEGWQVEACGGYFAYVRHPYEGASSELVAARLAEHVGVVVLPGTFFGPPFADIDEDRYLRFSIANVSNDTLRLVPARLTALNGLWESLKPVPKVVAGDFVAVSD